MNIGIGIDVIQNDRIAHSMERFGDRFLGRIYTPAETEYCKACARPEIHFAARFAAKEAAFKALGTGWARGVRWKDIEVRRLPSGQPTLLLYGIALERASELGATRFHVSLTHDHSVSAAVVIAPQGPVPALNANFLRQEINGTLRNNQDVAVGAGNAPNLTMNVNNYVINGDIDFLYAKKKAGDNLADTDSLSDIFTYRVDCTAANTATGTTSRVIAVYDCLGKTGDGCTKRPGV